MCRYTDEFSDNDSAVRSVIEKVFLSNRMLFNGKNDWCSETTGDLKSYTDLRSVSAYRFDHEEIS
jgi:hypothetical protein